jgi:hypothetical protein
MNTNFEEDNLPNVTVQYNTDNVNTVNTVGSVGSVDVDSLPEHDINTFTKPDPEPDLESEPNEEEKPKFEKNKYTQIDNLDEDTPLIYDGKDGNPSKLTKPLYGIFSVVTPEGVMNTNLRAFKCRGVFDDETTAQHWAKKIGEKDVFDVFVGDLYKWLPFDADTDKSTDIKYRNSKEQKLLMQQRENEMNELVGRKKAQLEKENKGSRRRKADRIIAGRNETGGASVSEKTKKEDIAKNVPKVSRETNKKQMQDRLKRMIAERNQKKEAESESELNKTLKTKESQETNITERETELKTKTETLTTLERNMAEISKRLSK